MRQRDEVMDVTGDGRIVPEKRIEKARIIFDPLTELPTLSVEKAAPPLRSRDVDAILADFP